MHRCSITVLLAAACLLLDAGAFADEMITCGAHVHRLSCESGVISVDKAFYGRADTNTCAGGKTPEEVANTACSLDGALDVLKKRCNGKKWCEMNANVFESDPCSDTFKYMETTYSCIPATHRIICEHSLALLKCDQGKVLSIIGADFGRRDHTTCAFRRDPNLLLKIDCTNPTDVVANKCNGLNSCSVRAAELVIDESCVDTSLYLELSYTCNAAK